MDSKAFTTTTITTAPVIQSQEEEEEINVQYVCNPLALSYIVFLLISLTTWSIITCWTLFVNTDPIYPIPVMGIPLITVLVVPAIISLFLIVFRTVYTHLSRDHKALEVLDLVNDEEQRKFFLLPLSTSGTMMAILPAYYFRYGQHYSLLVSQGVLGGLLVLLFMGMALIPEKGNFNANALTLHHRLFIPLRRKQ